MAIKISGTTVIDDSRNIQNVGIITATGFSGTLTGTATSATTLQTARTINGVSFNGSTNIVTNPSSTNGTAYSNGYGGRFVSTSDPSGGSDGDIWYQV